MNREVINTNSPTTPPTPCPDAPNWLRRARMRLTALSSLTRMAYMKSVKTEASRHISLKIRIILVYGCRLQELAIECARAWPSQNKPTMLFRMNRYIPDAPSWPDSAVLRRMARQLSGVSNHQAFPYQPPDQ